MIFHKLLERFSTDVAIDLGTSNTRVFVKDRGIIAKEPTVVSIHKKTKQVIALGSTAKLMIGKTPQTIATIRPLRHGVISDVDRVKDILKEMLQRALTPQQRYQIQLARPRVLINIPAQITAVERKAVKDVALRAGATEVTLIENPMAAAIGAGLLVDQPVGSAVMCMGGGLTEIAVLSLGGIVTSTSLKIAGDYFDQLISIYIKQTNNVVIGERTAEEIKNNIGSATLTHSGDNEQKGYLVRGRDIKTGLPKSIEIFPTDVAIAIKPALEDIGKALSDVIDSAPPEVVSDVLNQGITLTGALAQLNNLGIWLQEYVRFPVHIADDPTTCVVRGAAKALQDAQLYARLKSLQ